MKFTQSSAVVTSPSGQAEEDSTLDQQLRRLGYNMADEFNQHLINHMAEDK